MHRLRTNRRFLELALLVVAAVVCPAQVITLNFNSLPSAQGWSLLNTCAAPESSLFFIANDVLQQNTMGCGTTASYYTLSNVVTGAPFSLTVTARVTSDEVLTVGHLGLGFGVEVSGQEYYIGLGPGFIDGFLAGGTIAHLSTGVDTTQFHTYVLQGTPATGLFTLSVDGTQIASGSAGPVAASENLIFVGDGSSGSNAAGEYTFYRYQTSPLYNLCLLYDPTKAAKSGSTIPIKLQLCDGAGNNLSSPSITVHATSITQTSTSISGPVEDSGNANPDNDFRYDSTLGGTGGYIFNLSTNGLTTGTYSLNFTVTGDSATYSVSFQVK